MSKKRESKSYKSIDKWENERKVWIKKHPVYYRIERIYYAIVRFFESIIETPRRIKWFIQRGKRGWANSDTWGFSYYLTKVISEGVHHLKENIHGMPCDLTEGQWIDILNKITYTFESAERMSDSELYLIKDKKQREKWQKFLVGHNKKFKSHNRCMTNKEIREYEEGWKLFKEYFFNLWD